ncbi:hypothetical protein BH10PSE17_BH10PSE17_13520 [soil metagenome]
MNPAFQKHLVRAKAEIERNGMSPWTFEILCINNALEPTAGHRLQVSKRSALRLYPLDESEAWVTALQSDLRAGVFG